MEIMFLIIYLGLGLSLFFLLRLIYYYQLKREFKKQYQVDYFPKRVKIHKRRPPKEKNYYTLNFPSWTYANKDGTRDKRRNNNPIYYVGCDLYIDQFHIVINNPLLMIHYVNVLRQHNALIEKNIFEEKKRERLIEEKKRDKEMDDLNNVIDRFTDHPFEFELYCAKLYQLMGVDARNTSSTNDGGYDIILYYKNGEKGLVECKCYKNNKVGRPLIQKLVGANQTVGAEHLIFITTSDYSSSAKKYAEEAGVELIDGVMLLNMIYYYIRPEKKELTVSVAEWSLCNKDLKDYIPKDIYTRL